jgi:hypothetical protein
MISMKWRDRKPKRHISTKSKIGHSVEYSSHEQETFRDTKWIIRRGKSRKDRQYKKQEKRDKEWLTKQ